MRICYSEDPGILLTDLSRAYISVDHRWVFMVLGRAGVRDALQFFLREGFTQTLSQMSSIPALLRSSSQL